MSLILTRTQNLREKTNIDKDETRLSTYGGYDAYWNDTYMTGGIVSKALRDKALRSMGSTLETPVINFDSGVSISSTRSDTIADDLNVSAMQSFTFTTYSWGFTMLPIAHWNNEIDYEREWNAQFIKYLRQLMIDLDTAAITNLNTNKTQVLTTTLPGYTHNVGNSYVATCADAKKDQALADLGIMAEDNDFYGKKRFIHNAGFKSIIAQQSEHAKFNDQNKTLQFEDKTLHRTSRIANAGSDQGTGYMVDEGTLGLLARVEPECLLGTTSRTGHEWGMINLPIANIPCGTYYYESVGDYNAHTGAATALTGLRAKKEHFGFAVDVAMFPTYNSDLTTLSSNIIKAAVTTA